jgi:hypothetical protein
MFFQALDPGGMIAMFVREENGIDAIERFTDGREQRAQTARGETGVDEHAGVFRHEERGVA